VGPFSFLGEKTGSLYSVKCLEDLLLGVVTVSFHSGGSSVIFLRLRPRLPGVLQQSSLRFRLDTAKRKGLEIYIFLNYFGSG